ncbi:MAG: hypothetical protein GF390_00505 [Candidatus Pacebacteria bacterium]|nr:hypothetical protein [Candidatus Paceibacterota bacterium]
MKKTLRSSWLIFSFTSYFILLASYAWFSYSLTTPNLILSNWEPYWRWQLWMWQAFFNNRDLLVKVYFSLIMLLFANYGLIIKFTRQLKAKWQYSWLVVFLLIISPLICSYNALSHDVFNYIFNAKMVWIYQANPHVKVALDYVHIDDWVRFMHNIHTPAPYWYGWTALSLLPYILGFNKFLPTWIIFRLFSVLSVGLLFAALQYLAHQQKKSLSLWQLSLVFFNPLFLIEIISNSHNDLWMLVPAMFSLALVVPKQKTQLKTSQLLLSGLLMAFSISTKYATAVLLPIWLLLILNQQHWLTSIKQKLTTLINQFNKHWPLLASMLLFLPLLTARSQQFHPWYLSWSLVWLPLINNKTWRNTLLLFSFTSLLRYLPWLQTGEFDELILQQQNLITWGIPVGYFSYQGLRQIMTIKKTP